MWMACRIRTRIPQKIDINGNSEKLAELLDTAMIRAAEVVQDWTHRDPHNKEM